MRAASWIYGSTVAADERMMSNWRTMSVRTYFFPRPTVRIARMAALALVAVAWVSLLAAPVSAASAPSAVIGKSAADFALPAVAGSNVRLSEYRGQPVILSFWGSQCSTCARQLALLDRLYATYASAGLVVFGISVDDDLTRAQQYAHAHAGAYPLLLDVQKNVSRSFLIDRLPTTVLIDRSGIVRYLHSGDDLDGRAYVAQIRTLLDDTPAAVP
jgi:peroxiredoxin